MKVFKKRLNITVIEITDTKIAKDVATELKFLVNNEEELTKAEFEEKYEGYTVTFKYTKTGMPANGKVTEASEGKFKYAVQVKDPEGNLIPEELTADDFKEVTVVDASKAVEVTEVSLVDGSGEKWEQTVLSGVKIAATGYLNALGQDQDAKDDADEDIVEEPEIKSVVSDQPTVAYWDATGKEIVVLQDGTVTFTVEFDGIEEKHEITFDVKAEQEVGSVSAEALKVAAGASTEVVFDVLDTDDEKYLGTETLYYTIEQAEGEDEEGSEATSDGKLSVTHEFVAGTNIVTVYADAERTEKLGSVTVTAVDVAEGTPNKYELEFANKDANFLDLNTEADPVATSLDINIKAYLDEVLVDWNKGVDADYKLIAKSGNKNVPVEFATSVTAETGVVTAETIKVKLPENGAKAGTAVVDLYTKQGDLTVKVASIDIEVKNTTPKFTTLTLKEDTVVDVKSDADDLVQAVLDAVVESDASANPKLEAKHIEEVTYVAGNNVVLVKIDDLYGGALITLDARYIDVDKLAVLVQDDAIVYTKQQDAENAVASKATIDDITFEALATGKAGDGIKIVVENSDTPATSENNVDPTIAYNEDTKTITITLGATWNSEANEEGSGASEPTEMTAAQLKDLIAGNNDVKALIKVADSVQGDATVTTGNETTADGKDAVDFEAATLVFTFTEAVSVDAEEFKIEAGSTIAKDDYEYGVSKDGKTLTVTFEKDEAPASLETVTVTGVKDKATGLAVEIDGATVTSAE